MTESDIATLNQADAATLAKWWSELNRYGWPDAFLDPEPRYVWPPVSIVPEPYVPHSRRAEMINWIMDKIGIKECLRVWNADTMPGKKFDDWFDGRRAIIEHTQGNPQ